jgi:hypothetical protein
MRGPEVVLDDDEPGDRLAALSKRKQAEFLCEASAAFRFDRAHAKHWLPDGVGQFILGQPLLFLVPRELVSIMTQVWTV